MVGKTAADERRQGPSRRGRFDAIRGYVGIGRPANAAAIASFTLVGAYVGGGRDAVSMAAAAATTVTLLSAFGGYAINDYVDRDVDRINDPDRPIPRGAVAPVGTLAVTAVAFGLAAVVAGVVLPPAAGVIVATQLVALLVYTPW